MSEEMVKQSASLEKAPAFIPIGDRSGAEHITKTDIKMPRLLLAQSLSPEVQETEPAAYIDGLRAGMLFNDLTKSIYGKGPIEFWIIRADPPRWMEFIPREEGGGIRDPNVPFGDPRTMPDINGKTIATQFYDFVLQIKIQDRAETIALSLKGKSGVRAAKSLNGLVFMRNAPGYSGNYILTAGMAKNQKGTFAVYLFKNNGWVGSEEELKARKEAHESFKDKELNIERDADLPDDATEFDTSTMS